MRLTASTGALPFMVTREDDIDVHALRRQGWTISAIARHLGKNRKTIRAYLAGRPGRASPGHDDRLAKAGVCPEPGAGVLGLPDQVMC